MVRGATWSELRETLLDTGQWGRRVAAVRTQERGADVGGGDENAVRVLDLVGRDGRRLVQVEAWRTEGGGWAAGAWSQCID